MTITKEFGVTLEDGSKFDLNASTQVTNVGEVIRRNVQVPTGSEVTLVLIGAAVAAGQLTDIKSLQLVNLDDTNFVRIRFEDTGAHTVDHKLLPGDAIEIYNTQISVSETGGAFSAFSTIDTVSAQADTGAVNVALFASEPC